MENKNNFTGYILHKHFPILASFESIDNLIKETNNHSQDSKTNKIQIKNQNGYVNIKTSKNRILIKAESTSCGVSLSLYNDKIHGFFVTKFENGDNIDSFSTYKNKAGEYILKTKMHNNNGVVQTLPMRTNKLNEEVLAGQSSVYRNCISEIQLVLDNVMIR